MYGLTRTHTPPQDGSLSLACLLPRCGGRRQDYESQRHLTKTQERNHDPSPNGSERTLVNACAHQGLLVQLEGSTRRTSRPGWHFVAFNTRTQLSDDFHHHHHPPHIVHEKSPKGTRSSFGSETGFATPTSTWCQHAFPADSDFDKIDLLPLSPQLAAAATHTTPSRREQAQTVQHRHHTQSEANPPPTHLHHHHQHRPYIMHRECPKGTRSTFGSETGFATPPNTWCPNAFSADSNFEKMFHRCLVPAEHRNQAERRLVAQLAAATHTTPSCREQAQNVLKPRCALPS